MTTPASLFEIAQSLAVPPQHAVRPRLSRSPSSPGVTFCYRNLAISMAAGNVTIWKFAQHAAVLHRVTKIVLGSLEKNDEEEGFAEL